MIKRLSFGVHCRIGSLEIQYLYQLLLGVVHCRIGSLETQGAIADVALDGSLPYRQLRNVESLDKAFEVGSLPYRQLRK